MADEILRSKHAFGALENVLSAITSGKVDAYDILFLKDGNNKPYIGWVDKDNNPVIIREEEEVLLVESLPEIGETGKIYIYGSDGYFWNGTEFINLCKPTDVNVLESELTKLQSEFSNIETSVETLEEEVRNIDHITKKIKYEVTSTPIGTLVNYSDNEIRIMCPKDSDWNLQSVGAGGDPNSYYITFKTYAPNDDVVGYVEHLGGQTDPEILTDLKTDTYGRKYQPTWLAVAKYDEASDSWTYYGASSSSEKYIGWNYQIDWYNADDVMIATDSVRINLSNEDCHSSIEPYYVVNVNSQMDSKIEASITESKTYTDERITQIIETMTVVEF